MSAAWWPPKVGDRLRMFHNETGSAPRAVLLHVVSVFEHEGRTQIVGAWFGINRRRWFYELFSSLQAEWQIWPDGEECPEERLREVLRGAPRPPSALLDGPADAPARPRAAPALDGRRARGSRRRSSMDRAICDG